MDDATFFRKTQPVLIEGTRDGDIRVVGENGDALTMSPEDWKRVMRGIEEHGKYS